MRSFESVFRSPTPIIGMVHLLPLPGSPGFAGDIRNIYRRAREDAEILCDTGVDALIVENLGDEPYRVGEPEGAQLALMAGVSREIRHHVDVPMGINVQFNAWQAEIDIAYAVEADFIRLEVFVDSVISAQGYVPPCSAEAMRRRKSLGADMLFLADIQTKYTRNLLEQPIEQSAKDAEAAGADALIVTGAGTGQATPLGEVEKVRSIASIPVLVGSGTSLENLETTMNTADGAIVGSALKEGSSAMNPVSRENTAAFMNRAEKIRRNI
jgi:hypothetical protein